MKKYKKRNHLTKSCKLVCSVLLGGAAISATIPLMASCNKDPDYPTDRDVEIDSSVIGDIEYKKEPSTEGDIIVNLKTNNESQIIKGINYVKIGSTQLSNSEYTFDLSLGRLVIAKATVKKYEGVITISPIVTSKIRNITIDASCGSISNIQVDDATRNITADLSFNSDNVETVNIKIGNLYLNPSSDYEVSVSSRSGKLTIYKDTLKKNPTGDFTIDSLIHVGDPYVLMDYASLIIDSRDTKNSFTIPHILYGTGGTLTWSIIEGNEYAEIDSSTGAFKIKDNAAGHTIIALVSSTRNYQTCSIKVIDYNSAIRLDENKTYNCYSVCVGVRENLTAELELPSLYNGKYVSIIGDFSQCDVLTKVTLPETIIAIQDQAFYGCSELLEINIPKYTQYIGSQAFSGTPDPSKFGTKGIYITVDDISPKWVLKGDPILIYEFDADGYKNATTLKGNSYSSNKLGTIYSEDNRLAYCLTSNRTCSIGAADTTIEGEITIPEYITVNNKEYVVDQLTTTFFPGTNPPKSPEGAFYGCSKITKINIPATIEDIGSNMIEGCDSLKEINVDENNKNYSSDSGILYNKTKTKILAYPNLGSTDYVAPSTLETLDEFTFKGNKNLTSVDFSSSQLKSVKERSFQNCSKLKSFKASASLVTLGNDCFANCGELTTIDLTNCTALKEIKGSAFQNCAKLTSFTVPSTVETIGYNCFVGSGVTSVIFSNTSSWACYDYNLETLQWEKKFDITVTDTSTNATNLKNNAEQPEVAETNWGYYELRRA